VTFQSPVPLGATFAGKYRVDRVLGEGGMGIVVAAHHLELDQTVAIKFLLDDIARNVEGAERFRREARAAAKIQSDHVVRVLDVGLLDSGERYMVMEYLDGHDLAEELRQQGPLPLDVAVRHVLEALDAITQAHAAGIVHRDLKPANLYLARRPDGARRIKVLDFGISKSMGITTSEQLSLTRTSAWIGSPLYMAPEQMQSARDVDARADLWSLGAILYELIAGQPPYLAESLPQLCNLLLTTDVQPLREVRGDVPPGLNDVVMRCLSRPVDRRWQSAAELSAALAKVCPLALGSGRGTLASAVSSGAISIDSTSLQAPSLNTEAARRSPEAIPAGTALGPHQTELATQTHVSRTEASWGRTGESDTPGRFKLWLGLGAAVALAAVGLVFWPALFGSAAQSEATLESASAEPPVSTTPPSSAAQPTTEATVTPPAAPSAPSGSAEGLPAGASASAAAPSASPPATAETAEAKPAAVRPPRPTAARSASQRPPTGPVAPSKPATKPATTSDGISDFGGRR
jgi:serine/threonine-protein kinase